MRQEKKRKIKCPFCGYEMPVFYTLDAVCRGVFVKCKGRNCGLEFEVKIKAK